MITTLDIAKLDKSTYRWFLTADRQAILESSHSFESITECLADAVNEISGQFNAVELRYRGLAIGSYVTNEIKFSPQRIADEAVAMFTEVTSNLD